MARAIDADAIKEKFADILDSAYTDDYAKGFVAGLYAALNMPTLTTPNKWVSVEERLPDKPGHYLVCTNVNYWHGGCMDKNEEHKYRESGTPIGYFGTTMSVLDCYYDITGDWNRVYNCHVTHWMQLPEPPEHRPPEGEKNNG
jgi:hypothetical protein